jgi:hypothetical protein
VNATNYADLSDRQIRLVQQLSRHGRHNPEVGILMRREPAPNASSERVPAQLSAYGGRPTSRTINHTEQRADGQLDTTGEPRGEMIAPPPGIHSDLPALIALAPAHENRPPSRVKIRLDQRQRFLDPKPTTP